MRYTVSDEGYEKRTRPLGEWLAMEEGIRGSGISIVAVRPSSVDDNEDDDAIQLLPLDSIGLPDDPLLLSRSNKHSRKSTLLPFETVDKVSPEPDLLPSYRLQGDLSLYTAVALEQRAALKAHPIVVACIDLFWKVFHNGRADPDSDITREQYEELHIRMNKALHRNFKLRHARQLSRAESVIDMSNSPAMTKEMFRKALFEVVDQWTMRIDVRDYVDFLVQLFTRIVECKAGLDPFLTLQERLAHMLDLDYDSADTEMNLKTLSSISTMVRDINGEWVQQPPNSVRINELIDGANLPGLTESKSPPRLPFSRSGENGGNTAMIGATSVVGRILSSSSSQGISVDHLLELLNQGLLSAEDIKELIARGVIKPDGLLEMMSSNAAIRVLVEGAHGLMEQITSAVTRRQIDTTIGQVQVSRSNQEGVHRNGRSTQIAEDIGGWETDCSGQGQTIEFTTNPKRDYHNVKATLIHDAVSTSKRQIQPNMKVRPGRKPAKETGRKVDMGSTKAMKEQPTAVHNRYTVRPNAIPYRELKTSLYKRCLVGRRTNMLAMEAHSMTGPGPIIWDTRDLMDQNIVVDKNAILAHLPTPSTSNTLFSRHAHRVAIREAPCWKWDPLAPSHSHSKPKIKGFT